MMEQPTKKHKVEEINNCKEAVLFNSDTLSKIISYLPSVDVLNLTLTNKRFGVSNTKGNESIEESTQIAVQDLASDEQLAALPHYNGESPLADYHYLQLLRAPLTFDQLTGGAEYSNDEDKSCVRHNYSSSLIGEWETACSNNILRAGKHYVTFELYRYDHGRGITNISLLAGVMRPGQAKQYAYGNPLRQEFYRKFSRRHNQMESNNNSNVHCCMYGTDLGYSLSSNWRDQVGDVPSVDRHWDGIESAASGDEIGMLLDLDEGTLSVYKNGRRLGVVKRGLAGPYCWVASMNRDARVTIKRGTIPSS